MRLEEEIARFRDNLDLYLDEMTLASSGHPVAVIFDTADVRDAVVGMYAFDNGNDGINVRAFQRDRTLVQCLAVSGRLGSISLLPPHQSELRELIQGDFRIGHRARDPKAFASQFIKAVTEDAPLDETQRQDQQQEHFRTHAKIYFKAIQCVDGLWQRRLKTWYEGGMLEFIPHARFSTLASPDEFHSLFEQLEALNSERHIKDRNNFADATAIGMLMTMVSDFNAGKPGAAAPLFFDPNGTFGAVVERAKLESKLRLKINGHRSSLPFRGADYFVFRTIFSMNQPEDLSGLRAEIEKILSVSQPGDLKEAINRIVVSDVSLKELLDDLREFAFVRQVWVPFVERVHGPNAQFLLDRLVNQLALDQVKLEKQAEAGLEKTLAALTEETHNIDVVRQLWQQLDPHVKDLLKRYPHVNDILRDVGLLQFAFPKRDSQKIELCLRGLLLGDDRERKKAYFDVVSSYYKALKSLDDQPLNDEQAENLAKIAAVLWALRMHKQLIALLSGIPLPHYSLKLVYARAIFADGRDAEPGLRMLQDIEALFHQTQEGAVRADLGVGIAYLYFGLWQFKGFEPRWSEAGGFQPPAVTDEGKNLIESAVTFAAQAYHLFDRQREDNAAPELSPEAGLKQGYALNLYLYYMVEGTVGDKYRAERLDAAGRLLSYKKNSKVWQYRYDDTLARHFHRLALTAESRSQWEQWVSTAASLFDEALASAKDSAVVAHQAECANYWAKGFSVPTALFTDVQLEA